MAKPQRIYLNARVSPADYEQITARAEREGRSLGETIALFLAESRPTLRVVEQRTAEAVDAQ